MKTPFLIAFAGLAAAGLAAITAPASAAEWMSAPDIKRELVDTELSFRGRYSGRIIYRQDGGMRMVASSGRQLFGQWRIDEETGSLCSMFFTRRKAGESCFRTRHDGLGYRTDQGYRLMPLGF